MWVLCMYGKFMEHFVRTLQVQVNGRSFSILTQMRRDSRR